MFPPCPVILQIPLLSLYNSVHSLYMYISSQFNSFSAKKFLTQRGCNQAKPKICSNPFTPRTACAHGLRTIEGVTVSGAKGVLENNSFNHLQLCSSSNPKQSWVSVGVFTNPVEEIQDDRVDSDSHLRFHLIIMEIMVLRFQYCYFLLRRIPLKQKMINFIVMFPGFNNGAV